MLDTLTKSAMDVVQTSKKIFVDTFVKHEALNKKLHEFVEAQGEYTRKAYETFKTTGSDVFNIVKEPSFYTDIVKDAKDHVNSFLKTKTEEKEGKSSVK